MVHAGVLAELAARLPGVDVSGAHGAPRAAARRRQRRALIRCVDQQFSAACLYQNRSLAASHASACARPSACTAPRSGAGSTAQENHSLAGTGNSRSSERCGWSTSASPPSTSTFGSEMTRSVSSAICGQPNCVRGSAKNPSAARPPRHHERPSREEEGPVARRADAVDEVVGVGERVGGDRARPRQHALVHERQPPAAAPDSAASSVACGAAPCATPGSTSCPHGRRRRAGRWPRAPRLRRRLPQGWSRRSNPRSSRRRRVVGNDARALSVYPIPT